MARTARSTAFAQPTRDDTWFARTANDAFPNATAFLGDYSNIAAMPDGSGIVAYWTDMRRQERFGGRCGHGEDAFFEKTP